MTRPLEVDPNATHLVPAGPDIAMSRNEPTIPPRLLLRDRGARYDGSTPSLA